MGLSWWLKGVVDVVVSVGVLSYEYQLVWALIHFKQKELKKQKQSGWHI